MKKYALPENLINGLLVYLKKKPYEEVYNLISQIMQSQPVEEKEEDGSSE